jgi:hypothetical protein
MQNQFSDVNLFVDCQFCKVGMANIRLIAIAMIETTVN